MKYIIEHISHYIDTCYAIISTQATLGNPSSYIITSSVIIFVVISKSCLSFSFSFFNSLFRFAVFNLYHLSKRKKKTKSIFLKRWRSKFCIFSLQSLFSFSSHPTFFYLSVWLVDRLIYTCLPRTLSSFFSSSSSFSSKILRCDCLYIIPSKMPLITSNYRLLQRWYKKKELR